MNGFYPAPGLSSADNRATNHGSTAMKLRNILVAVTVTLAAIALATPAQALLKCKAKPNRKTAAIAYSYVNTAGGTVVYSYSDLDPAAPAPGAAVDEEWQSFANQDTCQAGGKGRNCVVSNDAALAAIAPTNCKIYMADLTSGDKCELYIKGCQVAQRPLPTTGYYAIKNNYGTPALWDAATGCAFHASPDNQPRTYAEAVEYLKQLNGDTAVPADNNNDGEIDQDWVPEPSLTDSGNLQLPTATQLYKLAQACAAAWVSEDDPLTGVTSGGYADSSGTCASLWPDPSAGEDNCVWTRTTIPATELAGVLAISQGPGGPVMVGIDLGDAGVDDLEGACRSTEVEICGDPGVIPPCWGCEMADGPYIR